MSEEFIWLQSGHPNVVEFCLYDFLRIRREQLGFIGPHVVLLSVMGLVVALIILILILFILASSD